MNQCACMPLYTRMLCECRQPLIISKTQENNTKLNTLLQKIKDRDQVNLVILLIMGDFNYPQVKWTENSCDTGPNHPAT